MYRLVIEDDEGRTTIVPLIRNQINIGREEGNTIRLTERNVSRRHAKLLVKDGQIMIEDLKSYNGVWINGSRINGKASLRPGDLLEIGDYHLSVQAENADAEATSRPSIPTHHEDEDQTPPLGLPAITEQEPEILEIVAPEPAVLLLLNTSQQGSVFDVEWPAVMIGRTEENEIAIDHASVSRHHAKIVCEDGVYKLYDLDSANGTQVNGEEFKVCDLRWGDILEIGQVRFRFCAADEDLSQFVPTGPPIQTGQPTARTSSSMNTILVIALVLVVVTGGGIFAYIHNNKPGIRSGIGTVNDAGTPVSIRRTIPLVSREQEQKKEQENQFKLAEDLFAQENYQGAIEVLDRLHKANPNWPKLKELQQRCDFESKNYRFIQESIELQAEGKPYAAYQKLLAVDKQSRYFARAEDAKKPLASKAVEEILQKVRQSIADKRYFEAVQYNSKALDIAPGHEEATKLHKQLESLIEPKARGTEPGSKQPTQKRPGTRPDPKNPQDPREVPPTRSTQQPDPGPVPTLGKNNGVTSRCERLYAAKRYTSAQKCFKNVLRRKGDEAPHTHLFLGHIASVLGNCLHKDKTQHKILPCLEARYHYSQFRRLKPNSPELQKLPK